MGQMRDWRGHSGQRTGSMTEKGRLKDGAQMEMVNQFLRRHASGGLRAHLSGKAKGFVMQINKIEV